MTEWDTFAWYSEHAIIHSHQTTRNRVRLTCDKCEFMHVVPKSQADEAANNHIDHHWPIDTNSSE